jgi:hypothetical protein
MSKKSEKKKHKEKKKEKKALKKQAKPDKSQVNPEQRREMIATAAYYIAQRRGFTAGDSAADWQAAEAEIDLLLKPEKKKKKKKNS